MRNAFRFTGNITVALLLITMLGCAGGSSSLTSPGVPTTASLHPDSPSLTNPANLSGTSGRVLLGEYVLTLGPDGDYSISEVRSAETHVNVTKLLFPPKCIDCFVPELMDKNGDNWDFKFTIKNPFNISGYDCRVILIEQGDVIVVNPSSYTRTFALPSDPNPINPFVIFDSGNGQNSWGPGTQATSDVTLQKPADSKFTQVKLAVDGSFPGNQDDPYMLVNLTALPPSVNINGSDATNIAVTVLDWQNNVNAVTVDLSPLGGSNSAALINVFDNMWMIEDVHYQSGGSGLGTYNLLLTATSVGNETFNYVTVKVTDVSVPVFKVDIEQEADHAEPGVDVHFTAIPHDGTSPYTYEWDMSYDSSTFSPDIAGEAVQWNWPEGKYNIRLKAGSNDGQTAYDDATIDIKEIVPQEGWAKTWGGTGADNGTSVAADNSGCIYVAGMFDSSVDFDPDPALYNNHSSNGNSDSFLSKFDSSGALLWVWTWGGTDIDAPSCIDTDDSGNIYVTGYFYSASTDFDPDPGIENLHTCNGKSDSFLSRFDPSGNLVWVRTWGGK